MNVSGPPGGGVSLSLQIDAALMRKTQSVEEMQGKAAVKLIEESSQAAQQAQAVSSPHPHVGSILDVYG